MRKALFTGEAEAEPRRSRVLQGWGVSGLELVHRNPPAGGCWEQEAAYWGLKKVTERREKEMSTLQLQVRPLPYH